VLLCSYLALHAAVLDDLKISRNDGEVVKVWLLGIGIVLATARWAWLRWLQPFGGARADWTRRILALLLVMLCFAATTNYARYGWYVFRDRIDNYDIIHYYLGPKYFEELGYFDLYPAAILADLEADEARAERKGLDLSPDKPRYLAVPRHLHPPLTYQAQTAEGYAILPYEESIAHGERVKERFTPERWEQFRHDFVWLQRSNTRAMPTKYWQQMINDHGFNGTPGWTGYATPLVKLVPVESVKLLGYVDVLLLLAAVGFGWWAFGGWSAGFLFLFILTTYSTRWPTISWAIMRYDYAVALIIATAMVKKGRPLLAGVFSGHAAAMRIFPATWLFGPGIQGAWQLVRHRSISRFAVLFFVGVVGWIALLQVNFAAQHGGEHILTHWHGMSEHMQPENLSSRRLGLAIALAYRGEYDEPWSFKRIDRVENQEPVRKGVALVILVALGWALRRADPTESFALGFVAFFALATASYYYFIVRAPLILLHACGLHKTRHLVALAWLLGIELFCNFAQQLLGGNRIFVIGVLGWSLLIYCIGMIAVLCWEDWKKHREPATEPA